jgi:hypothetical protein
MASRPGGVDKLRCEGLHPAVDRHVVDLDAALGQQLLDIAVGQPVAQVPAHRDRDHLSREAVTSRRRRHRRLQVEHRLSLHDAHRTQSTQQPRRGQLNSPWGLALAPASFGRFGGALLVGNFGDGRINAYNVNTGVRLGQLRSANRPIVIDGLWGLRFGNGNAAKTGQLLFSAGPDGESHGLLGKIVAVS